MSSDKTRIEAVAALYALATKLQQSADFVLFVGEAVAIVQKHVFPLHSLAVYLKEKNTHRHVHYHLFPAPIGRDSVELDAAGAEMSAWQERTPSVWREEVVEGIRWGLSVPAIGAIISCAVLRDEPLAVAEEELLAAIAEPLEAIVRRYVELLATEELRAQVAAVDQDLMALYDGSYDLSADTPELVLHKLIEMATQRISFDRAGIFLLDEKRSELRGALGVDEKGAVVSIESTVFTLYPEDPRELTVTALVARGERPYFLTRDLDGEGRKSLEGDIKANACVPLRVGQRIIGVMAVDNYYSGEPIYEHQLRPLMIMCNQGAVALERARLFNELKEAHGSLEKQVKHRTRELTHANAELETMVQEREVLLKEIHHRVKNNLQVISSLLSMQQRQVEEERVSQLLLEAGNRLHSMALIHEALYQTKDFKNIDIRDYVPHLVHDIYSSYGDMVLGVRLRLEVESVLLEADTVVNLGLIVNELVSNALKHAFPAGRQGVLEVRAQRIDHELLLVVRDDGVGVLEPIDIKKLSSMGMQVVDVLVRQLRGTLSIQGDSGMKVSLRIPV